MPFHSQCQILTRVLAECLLCHQVNLAKEHCTHNALFASHRPKCSAHNISVWLGIWLAGGLLSDMMSLYVAAQMLGSARTPSIQAVQGVGWPETANRGPQTQDLAQEISAGSGGGLPSDLAILAVAANQLFESTRALDTEAVRDVLAGLATVSARAVPAAMLLPGPPKCAALLSQGMRT